MDFLYSVMTRSEYDLLSIHASHPSTACLVQGLEPIPAVTGSQVARLIFSILQLLFSNIWQAKMHQHNELR